MSGRDKIWKTGARRRPDSAHSPRVELGGDDVSVCLNDRKPYLTIGEAELADPAVFVVGGDAFYFRANWRQWRCVDSDNPGFLQAIASARRCAVFQADERGSRDFTVPVYRVSSLPPELFPSPKEEEEDDDELPHFPAPRRWSILNDLANRFEQTSVSDDGMCFKNVHLGGGIADFVVSSDDKCVLFGVLPHEFDEIRSGDDEVREPGQSASAVEPFLRRMNRFRKALADMEPCAEIHLALLDEAKVVRTVTDVADLRFLGEKVDIVPIEDFEDYLTDMFG